MTEYTLQQLRQGTGFPRNARFVPLGQAAREVETLKQLVREALDYFTDEDTQIDRRDWVKEARKVV